MTKLKNLIIYWSPPLIWMAIIFYFSSRPRFDITEKFIFDFVIFKMVHMIEYGWLFFLLFRGLYKTTTIPLTKQFISAFILAIIYAATDEYHQTLVATREGTIRDVVIDTAGITLALIFLKNNLRHVKTYL